MILAPSILSADFLNLGEALRQCEQGGADWIHIDVMDGHFVPNLTMGIPLVEACRRGTQLPLDVHLMVERPEGLLEAFARAGATILTVHLEASPHIHRTIQAIRALGCKAGVALNPGTPALLLEPILPLVDLVLVMSVNPGFSGQAFIPESIAKVRQVRQMLDAIGSPAWLEVDGGINPETLPRMAEQGATAFVAASAIFQSPLGIPSAIHQLRQAMSGQKGLSN